MTLNIVVVEPQIPQNTGNIARTCAATGARLHIVGPMGFVIDDKKLKRSGLDYWHLLDITYYENIAVFFNKVTDGALSETEFTPDTSAYNFHYFSSYAKHQYTEPNYTDNAYILFGSETKGIDENLLRRNVEQCVRLPMLAAARCLNLSSAVAVGTFEVLRQWGFPNLQNFGKMHK
jgi:tRNA (cytidine/uridine-2'-O-)-methyltransferase